MPYYFLDTSALAKRYHKESGSDYLDRILEHGLELARRRFQADLAHQHLFIAPTFNERNLQNARKLLVQYGATEGLRTLDALQLAAALDLQETGQITILVAADKRLCRVAALAGCSAVNPEQPSSLVI